MLKTITKLLQKSFVNVTSKGNLYQRGIYGCFHVLIPASPSQIHYRDQWCLSFFQTLHQEGCHMSIQLPVG